MILELHAIQNLAPSNVNRDRAGRPKEATFGGVRRARVSSQSWKRAMREYMQNDDRLQAMGKSLRTRRLISVLASQLVNEDDSRDRKDALTVATKLLALADLKSGKEKGDNEPLTEYLLFVSAGEISTLAELASLHYDELLKEKGPTKQVADKLGKDVKASLKGDQAADVALFGRMVANLPVANVDGAVQVSHAISTHSVVMESDFYTAVDDLKVADDMGAGMMGTIGFSSPTLYRYANVDTNLLVNNLGDQDELAPHTIDRFIHAFVKSLPDAKKTSFANSNPASCVLAVVRSSGRWNLANAFARPVYMADDQVAESTRRLLDEWSVISRMYDNEGDPSCYLLAHPQPSHDTYSGATETSVDSLVRSVVGQLFGQGVIDDD